jgi:YgiT-type zinc finger domain-containing protein
MRCMICNQAETVDGLTSVLFERDELRLVIKNVPARICPACGEAFADEDVTLLLLDEAEEMARLGMRLVERDFK